MPLLTDARAPEGLRLYAIGDVHGCLDMLKAVHAWIEKDLAERPAGDWRVIHVGDYVDRGPDSRGVVQYLMHRTAGDDRHVCLLGNHDEMFVTVFRGDPGYLSLWLAHGGVETLASYGLSRDDFERRVVYGEGFDDAVPAEHLDFLAGLDRSARHGDYFFVHAGIDPEHPLEAQNPRDLIWIRDPFLLDQRDHGVVVIHGHTPVRRLDVRANRVGIDTAAVFGGTLSCIVLEGTSKALLTPDGLEPLV
jgi:serine/threonine protein phosphatase 1